MYADADILYSYLKPTDWLKQYSTRIINEIKLKTSAITITELELISKRDFSEEFSNSILEKLENIKNLTIVPLKIEISKKAIELRKQFNLNIFDSLHAATAILEKENIISTDKIFDLIPELKRIDPREIS